MRPFRPAMWLLPNPAPPGRTGPGHRVDITPTLNSGSELSGATLGDRYGGLHVDTWARFRYRVRNAWHPEPPLHRRRRRFPHLAPPVGKFGGSITCRLPTVGKNL
ncbi:hypothetical protein GCM10010254_49400 [Streptomyces chromofuscus]|nr:hypothetical protein GCM10010254_49400 [Streptomyces chromofuscus]